MHSSAPLKFKNKACVRALRLSFWNNSLYLNFEADTQRLWGFVTSISGCADQNSTSLTLWSGSLGYVQASG